MWLLFTLAGGVVWQFAVNAAASQWMRTVVVVGGYAFTLLAVISVIAHFRLRKHAYAKQQSKGIDKPVTELPIHSQFALGSLQQQPVEMPKPRLSVAATDVGLMAHRLVVYTLQKDLQKRSEVNRELSDMGTKLHELSNREVREITDE